MTNKNNGILSNDIDLENVRNIGVYHYDERTNKTPVDNEYCKSHPFALDYYRRRSFEKK